MKAVQIKHMADRFLAWTLPEDFNPDGGINFEANAGSHHECALHPTGTNLLDARQATAMVGHIVEGLPADDDKGAEIARLRALVARLYCASGCSCCRDHDAWEKASNELGEMLNIPKYSDESGFDFYSVRDAALSAQPADQTDGGK